MANVVLEFKASAGDSEPQNRPVLIVGQLANLQQINWTQVKGKLQPVVTKEVTYITFNKKKLRLETQNELAYRLKF